MEHISNFQNLSWRRKALAFALTGLLAVTGVASFAALNDTFVQTNQYNSAVIDLTGNSEEVLSVTWDTAFSGTAYTEVYALDLQNAGNAQLRYSIGTSTALTPTTGNGWGTFLFSIHSVPNVAGCTVANATSANALATASTLSSPYVVGSSTTGQQTGDRLLNAGAGEVLCMKVTHNNPTFSNGDSATQTVTFTAESTGL